MRKSLPSIFILLLISLVVLLLSFGANRFTNPSECVVKASCRIQKNNNSNNKGLLWESLPHQFVSSVSL
jgi:hypothetical protein